MSFLNRFNRCIYFLAFIFLFTGYAEFSIAQPIQLSVIIEKPPVISEKPQRGPYGRKQQSSTQVPEFENNPIVLWIEQETTEKQSNAKIETGEVVTELAQHEIQFNPRLLVIKQGEKIRITNNDPIYHNVFSLSGVKKFDIGKRFQHESIEVMFEKAGIVHVFCDIHSHMNADIIVLPQSVVLHKVLTNETETVIEVPKTGNYIIKAYSKGLSTIEKAVTISTQSPKSITLTLTR
jgi:plastocyanin